MKSKILGFGKHMLYLISILFTSYNSFGTTGPEITPSYFNSDQQIVVTFNVSGTPLAALNDVYAWVWIPGSTSIDSKYNINPASLNTTLTSNVKLSKSIQSGSTFFTLTFIPQSLFVQDISNQSKFGILLKGNDWSNGQTADFLVSFWDGEYGLRLTSPSSKTVFANDSGTLAIAANAPENSLFSLFVNNSLLTTQSGSTLFNYNLNATSVGGLSNTVKLIGSNGVDSDSAEFTYIIKTPSPSVTGPAGMKLGVNYDPNDDTKAIVTLWAPLKSSVYVLGDFNNWTISPEYQLNRDGEIFWKEITGLTPGQEYRFQFLVDETLYVADPFNDKVLQPDDSEISSSIYPSLTSFPGQALNEKWYFQRAAVLQTAQTPFEWTATNYVRPEKEKLVVYELLIRDFFGTNETSYKNLIDTISYFKKLGVNAIELMPITQFNGTSSWGYNPSFMFSPARSYGTKNDLKRFIDECHKNGIAVILDMVLNHQDLPNPYVLMYFDFNASPSPGKPLITNPFFNRDPTHPFNVFYDLNHESLYTKKFVDTVNHYWLNEYKFDGLRFDLTKGFTQVKNTNVGLWSAYDASRVNILKRMVDKIWSYSPDAYMIFEHLGGDQEETELSQYRASEGKGIMMWNKMTDQYNECTMGYPGSKTELKFGYYKNKNWTYPRAMSYMESHDEERLMYKNINFGNGANVKSIPVGLSRVSAATVMFYSIPGPKMLWQFGELGFDYSINRCEDGTIKEPDCRLAPKPVFWSERSDIHRNNLFNVTSDFIKLRLSNELFTKGIATILGGSSLLKSVILKNVPYTDAPANASQMNAVVAANFDITDKTINLTFPHTGTWYEYYLGGQINVTNTDGTYSYPLGAGGYAMFTDVQIQKSFVFAGIEEQIATADKSVIYPNPSSEGKVSIAGFNIQSIELVSSSGKSYFPILESSNSIDISNIPAGLYMVRIKKSKGYEVQKLVIE